MTTVDVSAVVHLEFGFDVELTHATGHPPDEVRGVTELAVPEAHAARAEGGHPRAEIQQLLPHLERCIR
jgi:hypothetical protein